MLHFLGNSSRLQYSGVVQKHLASYLLVGIVTDREVLDMLIGSASAETCSPVLLRGCETQYDQCCEICVLGMQLKHSTGTELFEVCQYS